MTKIMYLVTEDWYFVSHRLPLARAARDAGMDVTVVTRLSDKKRMLEDEGFNVIPFAMDRSGLNPLKEFGTIWRLFRIFRREAPDILHLVALKPAVVGGLAARFAGIGSVVTAVAGMGFLFNGKGWRKLVALIVIKVLVYLSKHGWIIVQNTEDLALLEGAGVHADRISLIRGSGVDVDHFRPAVEPTGTPVVMLASRLLWDKGVGEFVQASRLLREQGINARFVLVGEPDEANPASVGMSYIDKWVEEKVIEWWGRRDDMPVVLSMAHVVCLPSYREGLPKVLLEAMACGRPCVTTDAPGCRDAVKDGENGLLIPARDAEALGKAIIFLLQNAKERLRMGRKGRERAVMEFSQESVIKQTMALYKEMGH